MQTRSSGGPEDRLPELLLGRPEECTVPWRRGTFLIWRAHLIHIQRRFYVEGIARHLTLRRLSIQLDINFT